MAKIPQYLMYALMAIGVIVFIQSLNESYDGILYVSYIFFGVCILAAAVASVAGMLANPKSIKGALGGLVGMGAILGISYGMASDKVYAHYGAIEPSTVKLSGMGLYALYILFSLAVLAILGSAITKLVK